MVFLINWRKWRMINCEDTENGFTITWDPNDPAECIMNDWTEEDFINVIKKRAEEVIAEHESKE
jgi:hypothetical protein